MTSPILKAVIDDIAAHGLQFEMRGAVALIRLARPQKRNALNDGPKCLRAAPYILECQACRLKLFREDFVVGYHVAQ